MSMPSQGVKNEVSSRGDCCQTNQHDDPDDLFCKDCGGRMKKLPNEMYCTKCGLVSEIIDLGYDGESRSVNPLKSGKFGRVGVPGSFIEGTSTSTPPTTVGGRSQDSMIRGFYRSKFSKHRF